MNLIIPIILILSIIDIFATYNYVRVFNKKFPKLDYKQLEANPIVRFCWKKFGMKSGSIIAGIITFTILIIMIIVIDNLYRYFLAGALFMMIIYHILNFEQLSNLK